MLKKYLNMHICFNMFLYFFYIINESEKNYVFIKKNNNNDNHVYFFGYCSSLLRVKFSITEGKKTK